MQRDIERRIVSGLLVFTLFCVLASLSGISTASTATRVPGKLAGNIELTIDYGNSTQLVFPNISGETVFDILNQTAIVDFTQYAYGKFITSINGVVNNAGGNGHYWQYWVNGELAPVAADNYVLADADQVLWKYCAPETTPTTPQTISPELLMGLGIIGALGIIIVSSAFLVYFKIR
jgi:hypothetical protein